MRNHRNPRARLPRRPSPDNTDPTVPALDVADAVDDLRRLVGRADALARATEDLLERGPWGLGDDEDDEDDDATRLDRVSHLLGATVEATRAARLAGDRLAVELARTRDAA